MIRQASVAATVAVLCFGIGACSVPDDSSMVVIEGNEVQRRLPEPTTTTTRPTTTTPLVAVTSSTLPPTSTTVVTTPQPVEPVRLYFVVGDGMIEVTRLLTLKPDLESLVASLTIGPYPEEVDIGARTAIEPDDISNVELRAGTLTVEISPKFRELPAAEQRRAIAQLVLTFTAQAGVGQVTFMTGSRRVEVPRANGTFGAGTVSRDDYSSMILPPPTTTTPRFTVPTTSPTTSPTEMTLPTTPPRVP